VKKSKALSRSLRTGILVLLGLIIYAYGFQVTRVNLKEIQSEQRQESLTRVLRALAKPDIIEYKLDEATVEIPYSIPCPVGDVNLSEPDKGKAYLTVTPPCADPETEVQIEGFNFAPNTSGPIFFIPPSEVRLKRGDMTTDSSGHFSTTIRLPDRPDENIQKIITIARTRVGGPQLTRTAIETWEKIVETIFLALLATTFGILFAIPISFFAARNLMRDVTTTVSALALSIIGWPLGIWLGIQVAKQVQKVSGALTSNGWITLVILIVVSLAVYWLARWALPQEEVTKPAFSVRAARAFALLISGLLTILGMYLLANLAVLAGNALRPSLGSFGFLANFFSSLGQILNVIIVAITALAAGGVVSNLAGRVGKTFLDRLSMGTRLPVNILLAAIAGATLLLLLAAVINWFYQINRRDLILYWPAAIGAILGAFLAIRARKIDVLPIGLAIYYITRTILNALRAIEALIMAIVFVVWVGIGPFAGVLALSLHTIAALAKLYSEQVESIMAGPLEAIRATGATRLQTVIYGVIPQIVPPYISFTMYRWDINVRMSTIIGFAGGGGIGFLLIQNINLLNYRAASAQMLAIAIVVALMDYLSSYMREKVV